MRYSFLLIPFIFFSCSNWKISSTPKSGFYVKTNERVLVRNLNENGTYNPWLTKKINTSFEDCSGEFVDYESQLEKLNYALLDLDRGESLDSTILVRIGEATDTDFYLTGGFKASSEQTGIGWNTLNEYEKVNQPSSLERWTTYQFLLYDLKAGRLVYQMDMKRFHPTRESGDNIYYLPSVGVYNKMVKKLRKSCRCE